MPNFLSSLIGNDQQTDIAINQAVANAIADSHSPKKAKILNKFAKMTNAATTTQDALFLTAFGGLIELEQNYNGGLESILKTSREWVFSTTKAEYDVLNHNRNISPFGDRSGGWNEKNGTQYDKYEIEIPISKVKTTIKIEELRRQQAGIVDYRKLSIGEILVRQVARSVAEIVTDNRRSVSLMTAEALQFGKVDLSKYFETSMAIDFYRDPNLTMSVAAGASWHDPTHSILGRIGHICSMINEMNGGTVDTLILGKNAAEYFIANQEIKDRLDNRRIDLGSISVESSKIKGTSKIATMVIHGYKLDILMVSDAFFDDPKTNKKGAYIDKDAAIFLDLDRCEPRKMGGPVDFVDNSLSITFGGTNKKMPTNGILANVDGADVGVYVTKSHQNDAIDIFVQQSTLPVIANANATACLTTMHT